MRVPAGDYEIRTHGDGAHAAASVVVVDGEEVHAEFGPVASSGIVVRISTPQSEPTPAKVVALCDPGPCPRHLGSKDRDVDTDRLPDDFAAVGYAGADGTVSLGLPPGDYRLVVSRGLAWSVWPPGDASAGFPIRATSGWPTVQAEIARVVHPDGWLSADLHVHGVRSLDSSIGHDARVRGYAAAGVDVLVMTDHDVVTDLGPTVRGLGLEAQLATVSGEEITTANYGHYNAFPIPYDPDSPNGGAFDWGGAGGFGKSPADLFACLRALPGEQVIQVNHPEASGMIQALRADPLRGTTLAAAESFRLAPTQPDPQTGDTGLWSDDFTAFELLNSPRMGRFWERFRWWLQMLGRGFAPTGTADTDTHRLQKVESEAPHTWVFVGPGQRGAGLDLDAFAEAINDGQAVGTTGPFVDVVLRNGEGEQAGLGETLAAADEVTVEVEVQVPEWIDVDTIDVYSNITDGIFGDPGVPDSNPVQPSLSVPIGWDDGDLEVVATGTHPHRRRRRVVAFTLPVGGDAYVVILVRSTGPEARSMFPVVHSRSQRAFAFTNPVFVDADGGGYDHPPLTGR